MRETSRPALWRSLLIAIMVLAPAAVSVAGNTYGASDLFWAQRIVIQNAEDQGAKRQ